MKIVPKHKITKSLLDKSQSFLKKHNLTEKENLIITCAALIRDISTEQDARSKNQKNQVKQHKRSHRDFLNRLRHLKEKYWIELRYFGLSDDEIDEGIKWQENYSNQPYRAHANRSINEGMKNFFKELTEIGIKPKKQWDITYDIFLEYSSEIEEDEDNGADYYERIKAAYKNFKRREKN